MSASTSPTAPAPEAPLQDETQQRVSLAEFARQRVAALREGELGSLPIVVGIIVIAIYFQARNSNFLTAGNFVNLIAQMAAIMIIGTGIVFVLLLGEIDLSVGYVSGMGAVIAALLLEPGKGVPTSVALALALGTGIAIGLLQGFFVARVGVPSFVVTLAGLLGWNGVLLLIIGSSGTIVIQNSLINGIANEYMSAALSWIVAIALVAAYAFQQLSNVVRRRQSGLPNDPMLFVVVRIVILAIAAIAVVVIANSDRGLPYVTLIMIGSYVIWTFVAERTRFGRHIYAVGGNAEAARRAGINVANIKIVVFAISGFMAALGGLVLASRLSSVDTSTGGGTILLYSIAAAVIGGTSLFGGRGTVKSAFLGAIVITMIDNGLGLLNVSAGTKYIVTALVLLAAVTLDSLSRR
ncbi:MAG TPA: sugar ABC transporter permease, partial [Solirubrobacteraceae bacterium]|nr:sugar ABC transporter permease [Solirubrobacteraceae bacterium]